MNENINIQPKKGLMLRKIGRQYMIVEASSENVNMSNVYSLNSTAAGLWEQMAAGLHTPAELADWLCAEYGIERETAIRDVGRQLDEWESFGLITADKK